MPGFYILLWPQTLIELSAATLKEKQFTAQVRQATLAPVCISRIDTARAKGVPHGNPWGGQMGGTTVPLQVIQYQHNSIYSMFKPVLPGGKGYPTHVHQQSSAGSPPLPFVAVAKAHLSMLKTAAGSQSTDSLGFLFCAIDCILHNMGAVQIQSCDHTQWVTHATPNVEHGHRWMWRHSTISMEFQRTICCSFIAVPKPICSSGWCAEQHIGQQGQRRRSQL